MPNLLSSRKYRIKFQREREDRQTNLQRRLKKSEKSLTQPEGLVKEEDELSRHLLRHRAPRHCNLIRRRKRLQFRTLA